LSYSERYGWHLSHRAANGKVLRAAYDVPKVEKEENRKEADPQ
jgi:hypothetical protein